MAEKRLALDQIPAVVPGSGSDNTRAIQSLSKVNGPVFTGAVAVIAGMSLPINLPVAGPVIIHASLSASSIGGSNLPASLQLFIRVDGVDHQVFSTVLDIGVPGPSYGLSAAGVWSESLGAGPHTFELVASGNCNIIASVAAPATIVVDYPQQLAGGGSSGGGGAAALVKEESVVAVGGIVTSPLFTYVDVPGSLVSFSLSEDKVVLFLGNADAFRFDPFGNQNTQLGLSVDGVDYHGTSLDNASLGNFTSGTLAVHRAISLPAGFHTAKLRYRRHQLGNLGSAQLLLDADHHAVLTAVYTEPIFGIGSMTKVDAENASGTPTSNATAVYALIPGTSVAFDLEVERAVLFEAFATARAHVPSTYGFNVQLGLRVDGIDYDGSAVHHDALTSMVSSSLVVSKALTLSAGPHVAQLVMRKEDSVSTFNAIVSNDTTHPTRLTALYTESTSAALLLAKQFVDITSGAFSTGAVYPGTAIPGAVVPFVQSVAGDVVVHLSASSQYNGAFHDSTSTGLQLDAGSVERIGGTSNGGLGDGRRVAVGGTIVFPNVPPGSHTITAYAYTNGVAASPAIVGRSGPFPLRIVVQHN